jgi:hypothetical protein
MECRQVRLDEKTAGVVSSRGSVFGNGGVMLTAWCLSEILTGGARATYCNRRACSVGLHLTLTSFHITTSPYRTTREDHCCRHCKSVFGPLNMAAMSMADIRHHVSFTEKHSERRYAGYCIRHSIRWPESSLCLGPLSRCKLCASVDAVNGPPDVQI